MEVVDNCHSYSCFLWAEKSGSKSSKERNARHGNALSQHQSAPVSLDFWFTEWGKSCLILMGCMWSYNNINHHFSAGEHLNSVISVCSG